MSFGDISASRGNNRGFDTGAERDTLAQLKSSLAQFQVSYRRHVYLVEEMSNNDIWLLPEIMCFNEGKGYRNETKKSLSK